MKYNVLNLFGLGKTKFSASSASLLGVFAYLAVENLSGDSFMLHLGFFIVLLILSTISLFQNKEFASSDASEIVMDEFLGMYVCLMIAGTQDILWLFVLLLLFRVIDIWKFPPFSIIEKKFKNGFGVMADDLLIGIFIGFLFLLFKPL